MPNLNITADVNISMKVIRIAIISYAATACLAYIPICYMLLEFHSSIFTFLIISAFFVSIKSHIRVFIFVYH